MNSIPTTASLSPDLERLARQRVSARLGWITHASVYVIVISGLALLGAHQGRVWPIAPALGWGLGLLIHGMRVFAIGKGATLRERWVQKEIARLQAAR